MPKKIRSAAEIRSSIPVGDPIVESEIDLIGDAIEAAATSHKLTAVIDTGSMAGEYSYGDWWLMEKLFDYETWRGEPIHAGIQERLVEFGLNSNLQEETIETVLNSIPTDLRTRQKRINKVLSYFRNLGYNIHPGNWFDAAEELKIKWVVNWNSTINDHIYIIDDTVIIGKPEEVIPIGKTPAYADPVPALPKTRIDFFGSGNTGVSRPEMGVPQLEPAFAGTTSVSGIDADAAIAYAGPGGGGSLSNSLDAAIGDAVNDAFGSLAASLTGVFDAHNELMAEMFYQFNRNRLVKPIYPASVPELVVSGLHNKGDGYFRDRDNMEKYTPDGQPANQFSWIETAFREAESSGVSGSGGTMNDFSALAGDFSNLGEGAIWKPQSEGRPGRGVILLPSQYSQATVTVNGQPTEFVGFHNSNRGHYYLQGSGASYGTNVTVTINGTDFNVPNGGTRID